MFHPGGKNETLIESPEVELSLAGALVEGLEEDEDGVANPAHGAYPSCCSSSSSPVFSPGRGQASCGRWGEQPSVPRHPKTTRRARNGQGGYLGRRGDAQRGSHGRELILHPSPAPDPHPRQKLAQAGARLPWGGVHTFSEVKNTSSSVKPRQRRWALNSSKCSLLTLGVRAVREMG